MKIPLFRIGVTADDVLAVNKVLARGESWAQGPEIEEFEQMIAEYIETEYAVVFNSGTSALHAAMLASGIGPGDEVIVPAFTFAATANAPYFVGAKSVFADIEDRTFGLDIKSVASRITPSTKAIIAVHYAGCPCNFVVALKTFADQCGLLLIEDASESFGASHCGHKVGSIGHMGVHSFCQSKIITTGEGGAITLNDPDTYRKLLSIRSHGPPLGYNWRMPSMNAALGISQLNRVDKMIETRRANAYKLYKGLEDSTKVSCFNALGRSHVFQMFPMLARGDRDELMSYLSDHGIASKVYFPSLATEPLPVTDEVSSNVLCIHPHPAMTEEEINYIIEVLK